MSVPCSVVTVGGDAFNQFFGDPSSSRMGDGIVGMHDIDSMVAADFGDCVASGKVWSGLLNKGNSTGVDSQKWILGRLSSSRKGGRSDTK